VSLKDQLKDQQKLAMLAKDKPRLGAIRLLMAEIKQREVDTRVELNDEEILAVVTKMVKQRRDSISQFEAAGRQDLADKESAEIVVLQEFPPQQLTAAEIAALIEQAITESGAAVMADMGKVMAVLKPKFRACRCRRRQCSGENPLGVTGNSLVWSKKPCFPLECAAFLFPMQ
jgi:uncharacterized protein YqeY